MSINVRVFGKIYMAVDDFQPDLEDVLEELKQCIDGYVEKEGG